jgi:hypothetical protein
MSQVAIDALIFTAAAAGAFAIVLWPSKKRGDK